LGKKREITSSLMEDYWAWKEFEEAVKDELRQELELEHTQPSELGELTTLARLFQASSPPTNLAPVTLPTSQTSSTHPALNYEKFVTDVAQKLIEIVQNNPEIVKNLLKLAKSKK